MRRKKKEHKKREGWRKDEKNAKKKVKGSDEKVNEQLIQIADRKSEMIKFGVEIGKEGDERSFYREKDF